MEENKKYCKRCGEMIDESCIICPKCGKQVEELGRESEKIVINNVNTASVGHVGVRAKNKWVSFCLCLFLGFFGAHKFYEGKVGMGILYLLTLGIFGIGWFVDIILLLLKPNPYYI